MGISFEYLCPGTIAEASQMLLDHGPEAIAKMGGCTVMAGVRRGFFRPRVMIGLHRLPGLGRLDADADRLTIGAQVTLRALERSGVVQETCPLLARTLGMVASPTIRNMGTLVGNVASALPDSDLVPVLIIHQAMAHVTGPSGERVVPVADLTQFPGKTNLNAGEIMTAITVPALPGGMRSAYVRFTQREGFDRPLAAAAVAVRLSGGECQEARVALTGATPIVIRSQAVERVLSGRPLDEDAIAAASATAAEKADPQSDYVASADYRRHLVAVMVRRALSEALAG